MSRRTSTIGPLLAIVATLAALAGPAAADAPVVGAQETWIGATSPVSVPGNHLHRGDRIPRGAVLVLRDVTVAGGSAKRRVVLTLPRGKRLTGIALSASRAVSVQLAEGQSRYVGRRRVTLVARSHEHRSGTITVYGYGR